MMVEDGFDLRELGRKFSYDPYSGKITNVEKGRLVGGKDGGYLAVWVSFNKKIRAHRLAWALYYGEWPADEIDHIDGDGRNNRIENLRVADRLLQAQNVTLSKNNNTGSIGVCRCKQTGKFKATINLNGKQMWLGRFKTIEEAAAARRAAEMKLNWESRKGEV